METFGRRRGKVRRPCHNLVCRGNNCGKAGKLFPARLFGAGLLTPPTPFRGPGRIAGLPRVSGLETFGRRRGKVRRPCHNLV